MRQYHPHPILNLIVLGVAELAVSFGLIYNGLKHRGINGLISLIHFNVSGDFTLQDMSLIAGIMFLILRAVYIVKGDKKAAKD